MICTAFLWHSAALQAQSFGILTSASFCLFSLCQELLSAAAGHFLPAHTFLSSVWLFRCMRQGRISFTQHLKCSLIMQSFHGFSLSGMGTSVQWPQVFWSQTSLGMSPGSGDSLQGGQNRVPTHQCLWAGLYLRDLGIHLEVSNSESWSMPINMMPKSPGSYTVTPLCVVCRTLSLISPRSQLEMKNFKFTPTNRTWISF